MGLSLIKRAAKEAAREVEIAEFHKLGCKDCPLAHYPGDIPATGSERPLIYMLGEAPGKTEAEERQQFIGKSGQLLRDYIPRGWLQDIRWNNVVRSHPPNNRTPEYVEIEHCRPSVVADIEATQPKAIFGFGNVPLEWVSGFSGITNWRGRKLPVRVGTHVLWYYAFMHPAFFLRRGYGVEEQQHMFAADLKRAFIEVKSGLPTAVVHTPAFAKANVKLLQDVAEIELALRWASIQPFVGVDYETNCLRPYEPGAKILTVAVATEDVAFAFPLHHPQAEYKPEREILWKKFLHEAGCRKVVHNLSFEMEWTLAKVSLRALRAQPWEDTATAAAVVDERSGKSKPHPFSLEFLVQQYFGINVKKLSNLDRANLENTPLDDVLAYNAIDAKYHVALWHKLWARIEEQKLEDVYKLAVRRVPTAVLTQFKGVPVDQKRVKQLQEKYDKKILDTEKAIAELGVVKVYEKELGRPLNPRSIPSLVYIFDQMLGREEVRVLDKYTKTEKLSVKEEVLEKIKHPLAKYILKLRLLNGTKSKYIDPLLADDEDTVIFPDGLIHAQFGTYFVETGRGNCNNPNLQNFPKRDPETREVRSSIAAAPGYTCLAFDFGQIEARVIAMFTKDERFCKALWERYDVHGDWAKRIAYNYPSRVGGAKMLHDKEAMDAFRTDIKNQWTFPLFFGASLYSVAGYLNIPERVLAPHYDAFWSEFSGVYKWQARQLAFYQEHGYTECLTGRRRRGPMSINQIYNSPVQGTAAEIKFDAWARLSETGDPELQPEIDIHDDFTYLRVPEERAADIAERVIDAMVSVPFKWVNVPIQVEMSEGPHWADLKKIDTYASDTWKKIV